MMKKDEKLKLIDELLNKSRNVNMDFYNQDIDLFNEKENELTNILIQNQKDLKNLIKENISLDDEKIENLKATIAKDFNINFDEKDVQLVRGSLSKLPFEEIENSIKKKIYGQDSAINKLLIGFRRPYITGFNPLGIRNTILLMGPNGSGRHTIIKEISKEFKNKQLEKSDEVYFIDMKRYQSQAQENIFLQDLYTALMSNGGIVVFENFEQAYAPYNRMLGELVLNGKFTLNKRYNIGNNALLETNAKLTSQVVDSLNGNNKYLVFLTTNSESKVLDVFGKAFVDKILDKVKTNVLDSESVKKILFDILGDLKIKFKNQLEVDVEIKDNIIDYFISYYEPQDGIDSIMPIIDKFYNAVIDLVLNKGQLKKIIFYSEENMLYYEIDSQKEVLKIENDKNKEREEIQKELDEIVGLKEVKDYLKSLEDHIKISKVRKQKGLKTAEISKHMIFQGNPGTGKTTIARLISRMMKIFGILSQGQLVEVSRADLVGKYVGHTAPLTMSVVESALGGVLFIDEAYSLYRGKDDSFGLEAIDTIVKAMEDHRDDLIVILAGYTKEMEEFLTANSGLKSRFANIITFEDYTGQELLDIAKIIAKHKDYKIDEQACVKLLDYFIKKQSEKDERSGNGRLARNVVEEAILNQANRLLNDEKAEIDLLKLEDFNLDKKY